MTKKKKSIRRQNYINAKSGTAESKYDQKDGSDSTKKIKKYPKRK